MLHSGLVSITFRDLAPQAIVELVVQAGLAAIEWGGDVHVPPGDEARARDVRQMTGEAGLAVSAYGSYYRLLDESDEEYPFEAVLATAVALGAPVIRVWAGNQSPNSMAQAERARIAERARQIGNLAAAQNIGIAFEYHSNTLTETSGGALELLEQVNHPNVSLFWQPRNGWLAQENLVALEAVAPRVSNIHCFHWWPTSRERHPLADGEANWGVYLPKIAALPRERYVSLEFVKDGDPAQFLQDAATLKRWLSELA